MHALDDPADCARTARRPTDHEGQFVTTVEHNAATMRPALGRCTMATYGPLAEAVHVGRRLVISDTQTHPAVTSIREALAALHIRAQIVVPLMRDGRSVAAFAVHQQVPRTWTDEDVAVAEESAGRV